MIDQQRAEESGPESERRKIAENSAAIASAKLPPGSDSAGSAASDPPTTKELTADEQMALYEEDLKENDWGHQPC